MAVQIDHGRPPGLGQVHREPPGRLVHPGHGDVPEQAGPGRAGGGPAARVPLGEALARSRSREGGEPVAADRGALPERRRTPHPLIVAARARNSGSGPGVVADPVAQGRGHGAAPGAWTLRTVMHSSSASTTTAPSGSSCSSSQPATCSVSRPGSGGRGRTTRPPGQLGQPDHAVAGEVADVGQAAERQQVVLAELGEQAATRPSGRVDPEVAVGEARHRRCRRLAGAGTRPAVGNASASRARARAPSESPKSRRATSK